MKVNAFKTNNGKLEETKEIIDIRRNRWIDQSGISHPLNYIKPIAFSNRNVYFFHLFGDDTKRPSHGKHVSFSFFQNQIFLFMQQKHWLQKEENIRYLINIFYLTAGLIIACKKL